MHLVVVYGQTIWMLLGNDSPLVNLSRPLMRFQKLVVLACLLVIAPGGDAALAQRPVDRQATYFAVARNSAAFPVNVQDGRLVLLLVDFGTKRLRKLGVAGAHLLSPFLSPDGKRLLFVRHPFGNRERELVECETDSLGCKSILKTENNIVSPIDIGGGRILFAASPYVIGGDGRGRYSRYDFWLRSAGEAPQKLTNMQLYELHSASVAKDAVYFAAIGPRSQNPAIPKYDPDAPRQSEIFKLPFNPNTGEIENPSRMLNPLFVADGKAISPAVSSDGATIAFLRTRLGIGNYRYELVIRNGDDGPEKVFPASGFGYSKAVVVDQAVYAIGATNNGYSIWAVSPGDTTSRLVAEIGDSAVEPVPVMELSIGG
jgi:WD40-like Beta Propeller Repeat